MNFWKNKGKYAFIEDVTAGNEILHSMYLKLQP